MRTGRLGRDAVELGSGGSCAAVRVSQGVRASHLHVLALTALGTETYAQRTVIVPEQGAEGIPADAGTLNP